MTRLKEEWIKDIESDILAYELELTGKIGWTLAELSAAANGISVKQIEKAAADYLVAVIPVTSGEGVIGSFSESVAAILRRMGFCPIVTERTDVDGIYEAYSRDAACLFLADDHRFIGINREKNRLTDNNLATARGYVAALEKAAGGLEGREALLLGYGIVGQKIHEALIHKNVRVKIYDKNRPLLAALRNDMILEDVRDMRKYSLILDATNEGPWMEESMLHPDVWIAAPGIPLSLGEALYNKYKDRVIHDWLQIGVAAMMGELCR